MLFLLTFFLFFLFSPLTAWAYFDPGFGGYLLSSIISWIVTGIALASAAVIYFFRTILGQRLRSLWQKHQQLWRLVLLSVLSIVLLSAWSLLLLSTLGAKGREILRTFLSHLFSFGSLKLEIIPYYLMERTFVDPAFDKHLSIVLILLSVFSFALLITLFIWQNCRKFCLIALASTVLGGIISLAPSFHANNISSDHRPGTTYILDAQRMYEGYDLTEGKLIDENGRIVRQWPGSSLGILDHNGDFYGQLGTEAPVWGRYTWDKRIVWQKHFLIHHEIYMSPQGTIFTFTKETHPYNNNKVDFDIILEFDKNGRELQRYSFWDHLKEFQPFHHPFTIDAAFSVLLLWTDPFKGQLPPYDYFHLNSLFIIPPNPLEGKDPAFRRGNWLVSLLHGSMVFILDQDTKKILWHAVANDINGGLQGQHSVSMLPNGDILLFENGVNRRASRVLIIDPLTLKIKWQYTDPDFFSESVGYVQALPNGNFLVTESERGHCFELTLDKKIIWDYYWNSSIYPVIRYPKEMIDGLLQNN